ncbi:MAG: HAD family hydrolase [Theionarchaea archaeon]|nr:HAD family hydrolase [Theionarchaea archaeon]
MVKVVSFDLCGTLVDCSFADSVWKEGVSLLYAEKFDVPFQDAREKVIAEYDKVGPHDIRYFQLEYWFRYFHFEKSHHDLIKAYKDTITVYGEVPEVLERLSEKYTLIVATLAHWDLIPPALSSIEPYFDHIFSATSDFNYVGKHQRFYNDVLAVLSLRPGDVVHIGDDYVADYEVPLSIGMYAFLLDRRGKNGLNDLKEFESRVGELNESG